MVAPSIAGYALVDRIGAGGSGEVWRAEAERTGRTVALKVSHPSPRHGALDLDFKMEYQLHHRLEHDHIVRAREFGEVDDRRRFYTMDFLATVSLAEVYRRFGVEGLGRVALAVCDALEFAHSQRILHGDIKPANILVAETEAGGDGRVLLADFGHFRRLGDGPRSGVRGTLRFLPPEELSGQRLDARADLYSLGVTLREAILGRPLFDVDTPRELFRALLEAPVPSITTAAPEIGEEWGELLDRLVARNREDRPDSAARAARWFRDLLGVTPAGGPAATHAPCIGPTLAHVGREELVESVFGHLRSREGPRAILIEGEEGVGKTRLAEEIAQRLEIDGATVHRSDVREREGHHFSALRHVHCEGEKSDLLRAVTDPGTKTAADPLVPPAHLGPSGRERLVAELLRKTDPGSGPRFFLFDSLEVADLDSLDVLETLVRRVDDGTRLLLVARAAPGGTVRDRFAGDGIERVRLDPLSDDELRRFVAALLGETLPSGEDGDLPGHEVLDTLVPWLREATGGVPGRVESALRFAADEGRLAHDGRAWRITARLPDAPAASKDALTRFERQARSLSPTSRRLLEAAAVLGGEFERAALPPLESTDPSGVAVFLSEALQSGLLLISPGDTQRVRFAEPGGARRLVEKLPAERRVELHSAVADHLAGLRDDRDRSPRIARHLERAGRLEAAARAYLDGAEAAHADRAFREAGRLYRKAWDLRPPGEDGAVPVWTTRWIRAHAANEENDEVIRLADEIGGGRRTSEPRDATMRELRILQSISLKKRGDRAGAIALLEDLPESPADDRSPDLDAFARIQLGSYLSAEGKDEEARRQLTVARELALEAGLAEIAAVAERHLGTHAWRRGDQVEALEWLARARANAADSGDENLLATIWSVQAICHWYRLEAHRAARLHRRAAEGFRRVHRVGDVARSLQNLAHVLIELGQWDDAQEALESAGGTIRRDGDRRLESYFHYARANLAMYRGLLAEATEQVGRAVRIAEELREPVVFVSHLGLQALIHEEAGRWDEAGRVAERCLQIARDGDNSWGIANSLMLLARAARSKGDAEKARRLLDEAARGAVKSDQPVALFRIELERAETRAALGDRTGSRRALEAAREMRTRCDSVLWEGLVLLAHGRAENALGGSPETACQALSGAYERFTAIGAEKLRTDTLAALATAHERLGNRSAARSAWAQARSRYLTLGLPVPEAPIPDDADEEDSASSSSRRLLDAATTISRELTRIRPMDEMLERILEVALTFLGAERGVVALVDPRTGKLEIEHTRNLSEETTDDGHVSWSAIERVGRRGEVVHSGDALADPRLTLQESVQRERIRSLISLPIRTGQELLGAIYMDHRDLTDLFGQAERSFLRFIADMAAIGIHNSRAVEHLDESRRSLLRELTHDDLDLPADLVARDEGFRDVIRRALAAIRAGRIVLLTGPTGAGKDRVARAIHEMSGFPGAFVDCNLLNIPETLVDSVLFGSAKGAFTGADSSRRGRVEEASQGLLFLNEVGELPLDLQVKLLHFLDDRTYRQVGGPGECRFDGEIVCATNADLEELVSQGRFREDLYYRLAGCALRVPALADRPADIPELTDHFLRRIERDRGEGRLTLHPEARDLLQRCRWEGNVRELRACLESAAELSPDGFVRGEHLESASLRRLREQDAETGGVAGDGGLDEQVAALEIRLIEDALRQTAGNVSKAAQILGLTEQALRRRKNKYRLDHLVRKYKGGNG
jgi:Nif-specific regulatory protein